MTAPKRTDANHAEVVAAYRALGVVVADTHTVGLGFPDLLVAIDGCTDLVEIKTADGKLTWREENFHRLWPVPIVVVRTVADVEKHVREMREEALCSGNGLRSELEY